MMRQEQKAKNFRGQIEDRIRFFYILKQSVLIIFLKVKKQMSDFDDFIDGVLGIFAAGQATYNLLNGCSFCGARTVSNKLNDYKKNIEKYSSVEKLKDIKVVCKECYEKKLLCECEVTKKIFLNSKNCINDFKDNYHFYLYPYHKYGNVSDCLSEEGLCLIKAECETISNLYENWLFGTKNDRILGCKIIKELGTIETVEKHYNINSAYLALKLYAAQIGGNAFINFNFTKNTYIADYGSAGNPYYKNYFSATADVFYLEETKQHYKYKKNVDKEKNYYNWCMNILDLKPDYTKKDLITSYKEKIKKNHPDNFFNLGLDAVNNAERKAKDIIEAYNFLKTSLNKEY